MIISSANSIFPVIPVIILDMINGRMMSLSILISTSPGKEKQNLSKLESLPYSRTSMPTPIPKRHIKNVTKISSNLQQRHGEKGRKVGEQQNKRSKQQTHFHSHGGTSKANQRRDVSFSVLYIDDRHSNNTYNSELGGCLQ